ncbi:hypothetical protein, partial [Methanocalculus sp.]|uniref:hypothetical protein n=1 Tax=Methanocalculus sp. TaxID=2004547 RepID=UPI00271C6FED
LSSAALVLEQVFCLPLCCFGVALFNQIANLRESGVNDGSLSISFTPDTVSLFVLFRCRQRINT